MDVDTTGDTDEDEDDDDTDDYDTEEDTEADDDDTDDDDIDSVASSSGPLHFPYIDDDVRGFESEADTARSSDARHASSPPPPRLPHSARASASVSATTKRPPLVNPRTICPSSHPDHGIIVIGAGISGLATARTIRHLAHNHCHIRILEARQRIGGRIHTMREGPWRGLDMGAGWIHEFAGGNPMMSLVRQLGLRWRYVGGDSSFVGGTRVLLMDPVTGRRV